MKFSQILSLEKLRKLPTHRLKAYLKVVNQCRGSRHWDYDDYLREHDPKVFSERPDEELTKDNPTWVRLHENVKKVLATREHLE
jgi:hypothetical protein